METGGFDRGESVGKRVPDLGPAFRGGSEGVGEEGEFGAEVGFELAGGAFIFQELDGEGEPGEERGKERAVEEEESAAQGVGEERHQDSME
jgi:hypothetical protein